MARARNIKPGFYKNEDLAECSVWARFIFPGLWMLADREGRLEDRPKRIKAELLPFDSQDVEPLLAELASRKDAEGVPFIVRYQNNEGRFIQICKFAVHQSPHYSEKPSIIKPPALPEPSRNNGGTYEAPIPGVLPESSEKPPLIKRGSQPPDSLIPDSLIPDSPNPEKNICPEPAQKPRSTGPPARWKGDVISSIPVVGNGVNEYPIRSDYLAELQAAYPAVDAKQTVIEARAWCLSNPSRCKTESGVHRFLNAWFAKEQNRG